MSSVNWYKVVTDPRKYVASHPDIPSLPKEVMDAMWAHAKEQDPYECCGAVVLTPAGELKYMGKPNIAPKQQREDKWQMSKKDQADILASGEVIAIVHSHPLGDMPYPSELDMQRQVDMNVPWVILSFGPGKVDEAIWLGCGNRSLRNRGFRHGVSDCFEFGRDYFLYTLGIRWAPRPREWFWWKQKREDTKKYKSFYLENAEAEGFVSVGKSTEPKLHDVFLMQMRAQVPNHMAVYVGGGEIAHHPASFDGCDPQKLSVIEPYGRWFEMHTHTMRHRSLL